MIKLVQKFAKSTETLKLQRNNDCQLLVSLILFFKKWTFSNIASTPGLLETDFQLNKII